MLVVAGVIFGVGIQAQGQVADSTVRGDLSGELCDARVHLVNTALLSRPSPVYAKALKGLALHDDDRKIELNFLGKNLTDSEYELRDYPHPIGVEVTFRFGGTRANARKPRIRGGRGRRPGRQNTYAANQTNATSAASQFAYGIQRRPACS